MGLLGFSGVLVSLVCSVVAPRVALADVVTLTASKDNTMYSEDGAKSNGAGEHVFAGNNDNSAPRRALIAFDIAGSIPAGSTITGVQLTLTVTRTKSGSETVALHTALADWGEGISVFGAAQGGNVEVTVDGQLLVVTSVSGQSASEVAANIAAAINGDPVLSAAGVTAFAAANAVVTTGTIESSQSNDPGITLGSTPQVPALANGALALMASLMLATALWAIGRRGAALP